MGRLGKRDGKGGYKNAQINARSHAHEETTQATGIFFTAPLEPRAAAHAWRKSPCANHPSPMPLRSLLLLVLCTCTLLLAAAASPSTVSPCGKIFLLWHDVSVVGATVIDIANSTISSINTSYPTPDPQNYYDYFISELGQYWLFSFNVLMIDILANTSYVYDWSPLFGACYVGGQQVVAGYDAKKGLLYVMFGDMDDALYWDLYSIDLTARVSTKVSSVYNVFGSSCLYTMSSVLSADGSSIALFGTSQSMIANDSYVAEYTFATDTWSPWMRLSPAFLVNPALFPRQDGTYLTFYSTPHSKKKSTPVSIAGNGTWTESFPPTFYFPQYLFGSVVMLPSTGEMLLPGLNSHFPTKNGLFGLSLFDVNAANFTYYWNIPVPNTQQFHDCNQFYWSADGCS